MAARGYEFYLLVLKISLTRSQIRIPSLPCNILYICNFFFADTASVCTYPVNPAYESETS